MLNMKRDLDLVKSILVKIEANPDPIGWIEIELLEASAIEVAYHVKILSQSGLIEAVNVTTRSGFDWKAISLTWKGHEFLDTIRNDTVWVKTKEAIKSKGGSLPFTLISKIAAAFVANHHLLDKL